MAGGVDSPELLLILPEQPSPDRQAIQTLLTARFGEGGGAHLKNIQIIDGALNATFSIFQATDEEFDAIFPAEGQDMEISEDFHDRVGLEKAKLVLEPIWERPILKRDANGIHGTLYYGYEDRRKYLPHTKREVDWDDLSINAAQRVLFASKR